MPPERGTHIMKIPEKVSLEELESNPLPFARNEQILYRLFMLILNTHVLSLFLGGAFGALVTYLILHR